MSASEVEEVAIRYVLTAQDDGTAKITGAQKRVRDQVAETNTILRASGAEYVKMGGQAIKATTSVAGAVAKQSAAVKTSSDAMIASQKKVADSVKASADEWKALASTAVASDDLINKSRAESAAATDKAAQKEIAALRETGKSYQQIAKMAQESATLRGKSANEAAAAVELAAKREAAAIRGAAGSPSRGARAAASVKGAAAGAVGFGSHVLSGVGSAAVGVGAVGVGAIYEGLKKSRSITESTLQLERATHLKSREAMALAVIAEATGVQPRTLGMSFATAGGQATKALKGQHEGKANASTEAFSKLKISPDELKKTENNLPALYDLITKRSLKLPAAEGASVMRTMLGRGAQMAGVLEAGGPLAGKKGRLATVGASMPSINPATLKHMQESFVALKAASTGIELSFAQAFGPTLVKLLSAITPLIKPLGALLQVVILGAITEVGKVLKGPVGAALATFGKQALKAGKELLSAFAPAMPFFKNVLLPLLKGVALGVGIAIIGGIKLLAGAVKLLAPAFGAVGTLLKPFKGTIETIGKVIGVVFSGEILGAVASLGKITDAVPFLGKVFRPVVDIVRGFGSILSKVFSPMGNLVKVAMSVVVGVVIGSWKVIKQAFTVALKAIEVVVKTYWTVLSTIFTTEFQIVEAIVTTAWTVIKAVFTTMLAAVEILVKTWWDVQKAIWTTGFNIVKAVVTGGWEIIKSVFTSVFDAIRGAVSAVIGFIGDHWKMLVPLLTGPFAPVVAVALNFGPQILKAIEGAFNSVIGFLGSLPSRFLSIGKQIIEGLVSGVEQAGPLIMKALKKIPGFGLAQKALGAIKGGAEGIGNILGLAGGGFVPGDPHRDGTLALLSGNEFVVTGGGQAMMEAHAPGLLEHLAGNQPSHFAGGGWVAPEHKAKKGKKPPAVNTYFDSKTGRTLHMTAKEHSEYTRHAAEGAYNEKLHGVSFSGPVSTFGPPGEAAGTTAYGGSSSMAGLALNPHGGSNWNDSTARALAGKLFHVEVAGHSGNFKVIDKGPDAKGPKGWRVGDLTGAAAKLMGFDPAKFPTDAIGKFTEVVGGVAKATSAAKIKVPELAGSPLNPVTAFQTGYQAGLKGQPLSTTGVLAAAKAASKVTMRALQEGEVAGAGASGVGGGGGGTIGKARPKGIGAKAWSEYLSMASAAESIVGKPYVYGGGHGSWNSSGYDCSGAVSYVLHAGRLTNTPMATDALKNWGLPGDGKLVTVGVRGTTGENAHTMIRMGSAGVESGGGGSQGKPEVHIDKGWDGVFPIHRHPPGLRRGGRVKRALRRFNRGGMVGMGPKARGAVATSLRMSQSGVSEAMLDPDSPRFVGFGLRRGGHVKRAAAAHHSSTSHHSVHVANHLHPKAVHHSAIHKVAHHHAAAHHAGKGKKGKGMSGGLSGVASTLGEAMAQLAAVSSPLEGGMPGGGVGKLMAQGVAHAAGGAINEAEGASNTGPEANNALGELSGILDGTSKAVQNELKKMASGLKKQLAKLKAHHAKPAQIKGLESKIDEMNTAVADSGRITLGQLDTMASGIKAQVAKLKAHHGSKVSIRRLESALGLVQAAVGQRVGMMVKQVNDEQAALERVGVARQQANEVAGVEAGSSGAISSEMAQDQLAVSVGQQQQGQLQNALQQAERAGDTQDAEQIKAQLEGIAASVQQAAVDMAKKARELVERQAAEVTEQAEHALNMVQGQMSLNQAVRSITNHGEESPGEMRQRAAEMQQAQLPAMQGVLSGLGKQYEADMSVGDTKGAQEIQEKILAEQTAIATTSAEIASLTRQAAETQAHLLTEIAQHGTNMAESGLSSLELHQKLAGTYETGGQQRADYINKQILPALNKELSALVNEKKTAEEQGDTKLAEQIAEAIAGQQNKILETQLQVQEETKSATQAMANAMTNAGGSLGFQFNQQSFTDLIGVGVGM